LFVCVCLFCLAGAGQSGKSTVAKQMKIIHMDGFTEEEKKSYTSVICSNIVVAMRAILFAAKEMEIHISKSLKVSFASSSLAIFPVPACVLLLAKHSLVFFFFFFVFFCFLFLFVLFCFVFSCRPLSIWS
jgi:hypothetical protein